MAIWCEDEAGPFQAIPHPGNSWQPEGHPATQPHEYVRAATTKVLTLFEPSTGQVRVHPVASCTNTILHDWLKRTLGEIVAALAAVEKPLDPAATRAAWHAWQDGLTVRFTLPEQLPALRALLVWDNLAGHKTAEMVLWLCQHGIMPLYTPLGASWLNMAESIQRILKRRALDGQHPHSPEEIGTWFEQTAHRWNQQPTPFVWDGQRRQQRRRPSEARHRVGGSRAHTQRPLRRTTHRHHSNEQCPIPYQITH